MEREPMPRLPAIVNEALDQLTDDAAEIYTCIAGLIPPNGTDDRAWGELIDRAQRLIVDLAHISGRKARSAGEPDLLSIMGDKHAA